MQTQSSKKTVLLICSVFLMIMFTLFSPSLVKCVRAESLASKNERAHSLYRKKARSLNGRYKYMDLTNDGIHEGLIEYHVPNAGSTRRLLIYTYRNGGISQLLNFDEYGFYKIAAFKQVKAFALAGAGHGNEWIVNFRLVNGKFAKVSEKGRHQTVNGYTSWIYYGSGNTTISKTKYDSLTSMVRKGKKADSYLTNWAS